MRMCMLTYPAEYIMIHNSSNDDQQRTLQKVNNSVNIIIVLFALAERNTFNTKIPFLSLKIEQCKNYMINLFKIVYLDIFNTFIVTKIKKYFKQPIYYYHWPRYEYENKVFEYLDFVTNWEIYIQA